MSEEQASENRDDFPKISFETMRYTWDLYFRTIQAIIIVNGATIAFLANAAFGLDHDSVSDYKIYALIGMVFAGVGGGVALIWRFVAQVLCEGQLYVPAENYRDYFERTKTWVAFAVDKPQCLRAFSITAEILKVICAVCVLGAWTCGLYFFYVNL